MLADSIQGLDQRSKENVSKSDMAFLIVKVDIDCKLYCDGDFLDLIEANKVKKIPIEVGQHLITIESENTEDVSEDREVSIEEAGKNYLLIVNGMHDKIASSKEPNNKDKEGFINRICCEDGLTALINAAWMPAIWLYEEPPFRFEQFEGGMEECETLAKNLLNGESILVYQVPPKKDHGFEMSGERTMAKISEWDSSKWVECRLFVLSLKALKEGLWQLMDNNSNKVLMEEFIEKISFYNSEENDISESGIPVGVILMIESALLHCNKSEAISYIKSH